MVFESRFRFSVALALGLATTMFTFPSAAFAQAGGIPKFQTNGDWTVSPTQVTGTRGINGVKIPCVAMNEFDNGFVVRLSGGDQKMLAMAIDFRQDVFTKGRKYPAMISLGDGYVQQAQATAFTENTLIFNLRDLPDFYAQMAQQNVMGLSIENNNFKFSLGNLTSSLVTLEACFRGEIVKAPQTESASMDAQQGNVVPYDAPVSNALPQSFDDIVQSSDVPTAPFDAPQNNPVYPRQQAQGGTELPRLEGRVSKSMDTDYREPAPIRSAALVNNTLTPEPGATNLYDAPYAAPTPPQMEWEAFAGEDVQMVLRRWSEQAGYDLQWQAKNTAKVTKNIKVGGDFKSAVDQLLAQNAGSSGFAARIQGGNGY